MALLQFDFASHFFNAFNEARRIRAAAQLEAQRRREFNELQRIREERLAIAQAAQRLSEDRAAQQVLENIQAEEDRRRRIEAEDRARELGQTRVAGNITSEGALARSGIPGDITLEEFRAAGGSLANITQGERFGDRSRGPTPRDPLLTLNTQAEILRKAQAELTELMSLQAARGALAATPTETEDTRRRFPLTKYRIPLIGDAPAPLTEEQRAARLTKAERDLINENKGISDAELTRRILDRQRIINRVRKSLGEN